MRGTSQAAAGLVAIVLAGCSGRNRSHDAGTTTGGGAGTRTGTAIKETPADTASAGKESGTADSGGQATVGKDSQKTQPSETQPAPSTGDSRSR